MRTAKVLKHSAHAVILGGAFIAFRNFNISTFEFWAVIIASFLLWLVLRLLAITGELIYGMRNDSARMLANIERSIYSSNAITKEIRDILDSEAGGKSS